LDFSNVVRGYAYTRRVPFDIGFDPVFDPFKGLDIGTGSIGESDGQATFRAVAEVGEATPVFLIVLQVRAVYVAVRDQ